MRHAGRFFVPPAGAMPTSPRHSTAKPLLTSVGAASPTPRASNVQAPTFQSVSGSGASVETILNLGTILPKIPLVDRKGRYTVVSADSRHAFRCFSRAGEVPRRRHGQADLPANLPSHGKKQTRRNSRRVLICQKVSQSSRLWSLEKIQSVFCGGAYAAKNTLRAAQCHSAAYSGARRGSE